MPATASGFPPFVAGGRFRVVPPGTPPADGELVDLVLTRGAFGSGEHETTASCLEILGNLDHVDGSRVLDLGSGTAILSLAALALGARRAVCVDVDPAATAVARANCRLNAVEKRVELITGTLADAPAGSFDLILANIYADVLLAVAPNLVARTSPGAILILSGITWEDNWAVRDRYTGLGCHVVANRMLETFSSVVLVRV